MNTGQTLLAVGAMILLSVLILRVNGTFLTTGTTIMNTKFDILATSIATSKIEEISRKRFDEFTTQAPATSLTQLSSVLGPDGSENVTPRNPALYDDIDDYNGDTTIVNDMPSAIFNVLCRVTYVNPDNLDGSTSARTWFKKITVIVSSKSMVDTVKISTIFSYWY